MAPPPPPLSPYFQTFMEPRNRFQGMNSASLCSLVGRYDNPIPPRFLAPIDSLKIPALCARRWNLLTVTGAERRRSQLISERAWSSINIKYSLLQTHSTWLYYEEHLTRAGRQPVTGFVADNDVSKAAFWDWTRQVSGLKHGPWSYPVTFLPAHCINISAFFLSFFLSFFQEKETFLTEHDGIHHRIFFFVSFSMLYSTEYIFYCKRAILLLSSSKILTPHPPLLPVSVSSPRTKGGEGGTRSQGGEGVNISEDARHRIGLLQYNPSTLSCILCTCASALRMRRAVLWRSGTALGART